MKHVSFSRREYLKLLGYGAALLAGAPYSGLVSGSVHGAGMPNIFILVFDALTARHLSLHGYPRETMPNLNRFAEQATVFHQHYTGGSYTTSGVASLLTGTYPWTNRAINMFDDVAPNFHQRNIFNLLGDHYTTTTYTHNLLAAVVLGSFQRNIRHLHRVSEGGLYSSLLVDRVLGKDLKVADRVADLNVNIFSFTRNSTFMGPLLYALDKYYRQRYLDRYHDLYPHGLPHNENRMFFTLEDTVGWLLDWLPEATRPVLGYFHFLPPHYPYYPRADFIGRFKDGWQAPAKQDNPYFTSDRDAAFLNKKRNQYDEFIAYADDGFSRFLDGLEQQGLLENSYIFFTSDHGELFERGIWGHVNATLYQPLIHIPLLVRAPGQTTRQDVHTPTSAVDILPTLCRIAGLPIPDWAEGRALPACTDQSPDPQRAIYTVEAKESYKYRPFTQASIAMLQNGYKLIRYYGYQTAEDVYEFYNIDEDAEEMTDIYNPGNSIARRMQQEMLSQLEQADQALARSLKDGSG